jgi:hypothetical protein
MDFLAFQNRFEKLRIRKVLGFRQPDPKATDAEIQEAEWRLACKLGAKFVAFLHEYGGGNVGLAEIFSVHPGATPTL